MEALEGNAVWHDPLPLNPSLRSENQPCLVAVMGEAKAGKSTLINALLGEDVMPTDAVPSTMVVTVFLYGDKREFAMHFSDGRVQPGDISRLRKLTDYRDERVIALRDSIEFIEVFCPCEILRTVNLMCTPGASVGNPRQEHLINLVRNNADKVLWLLNATGGATSRDASFINALGTRLKPLAILNRIDFLDDEEPEEQLDRVLHRIAQGLGDTVQAVVPVSAKLARAGNLRESRWRESSLRPSIGLLEQRQSPC